MKATVERKRLGASKNQAIEFAGLVFLRGIVAEDKSGTVADQTRQILMKIEKNLEAAGSSKTRILQATVYLSDMGRKSEMNEVWYQWMDPEHEPARVTVGVELWTPETLVEIMIIAAKTSDEMDASSFL